MRERTQIKIADTERKIGALLQMKRVLSELSPPARDGARHTNARFSTVWKRIRTQNEGGTTSYRDCPNTDPARMLLRETLLELGQADEIAEVEVSDPAQADALNFPGSPTIRVNGIDVDNLTRQNSYGLSCRTYLIGGSVHGLPAREMIRNAIQSAVSRD